MEGLLSNIQSIGIFALVLSILVIVHEWGHFITAKKLGIKVLKFSLGFGPKLFSWMHDGTEFLVCAIPLGGYVKMAGEERSECKGAKDEFFSRPPGHRALVVVNGPMVNLVFAYICLVFVFWLGYPGFSTKIYDVKPGSPAQVAGIVPGDTLIEFDGKKLHGWIHLELLLEKARKTDVPLKVLRNGQPVLLSAHPNFIDRMNIFGEKRRFADLGIDFDSTKIMVLDGSQAEKAGIKDEDIIVQIDGRKISHWKDIQEAVSQSKGATINIVLIRNNQEVTSSVVPNIEKQKDKNGVEKEVRKIGIGPTRSFEYTRFAFHEALAEAFEELRVTTVLTYRQIFRLITGDKGARDSVTGPVGIFYMVKGASHEGIIHLIWLLGSISAGLALFNLLPLIPLDGGHLFLLAIEKLRGRMLSPKVDEYMVKVGFSLIIMLALYVFYSDFSRFGWIDKIKNLFN